MGSERAGVARSAVSGSSVGRCLHTRVARASRSCGDDRTAVCVRVHGAFRRLQAHSGTQNTHHLIIILLLIILLYSPGRHCTPLPACRVNSPGRGSAVSGTLASVSVPYGSTRPRRRSRRVRYRHTDTVSRWQRTRSQSSRANRLVQYTHRRRVRSATGSSHCALVTCYTLSLQEVALAPSRRASPLSPSRRPFPLSLSVSLPPHPQHAVECRTRNMRDLLATCSWLARAHAHTGGGFHAAPARRKYSCLAVARLVGMDGIGSASIGPPDSGMLDIAMAGFAMFICGDMGITFGISAAGDANRAICATGSGGALPGTITGE